MAGRSGKEETRERLLRAAGRAFRTRGFGGAGVDAVAKDAGVTSGAVYEHFGSKSQLLYHAVVDGLREFRNGLAAFKRAKKGPWLVPFAKWYLSADRRANLEESCALATLSLDAARGDDTIRGAYDNALKALIDEVASGLPRPDAEKRAIAILALLAGGLMMGHATLNKRFGDRISSAIVDAVQTVAKSR